MARRHEVVMKRLPTKMWAREAFVADSGPDHGLRKLHPSFYFNEGYARADSLNFGGRIGRVTIVWEKPKKRKLSEVSPAELEEMISRVTWEKPAKKKVRR